MSVAGLLPVLHEFSAYSRLLERLRRAPAAERAWLLAGLPRAARPCLLAALQQDLARPLLAVVNRPEEAARLHEQLLAWTTDPGAVMLYPEPDALPYERIPAGDVTARARMAVLARLSGLDQEAEAGKPLIVVTCTRALMQKTMPLRDLASHTRTLRRGHSVSPQRLMAEWLGLGYEAAILVEQPGQVSHRGGIIDIFPMTSDAPARIEFFGDEVDSIRRFDPATQRSTGQIDSVVIAPAAEVLPHRSVAVAETLAGLDTTNLTPDESQRWAADIHRLADEAVQSLPRDLWYFFAPYYYGVGRQATVLDHFDGLVVLDGPADLAALGRDIEEQSAQIVQQKMAAGLLPPGLLPPFVPWQEVAGALQQQPRLALTVQQNVAESLLAQPLATAWAELDPLPFAAAPVHGGRLREVIQETRRLLQHGQRVVLTSHQAKRLSALLREQDIAALPTDNIPSVPAGAFVIVVQGSLGEGWILGKQQAGETSGSEPPSLTLLTDVEIFGWAKPRRAAARKRAAVAPFLSDLTPGDYVVHIEHGVGIFRGLTRLNLDGGEREYLYLEYAEGDKLYVPTDHLDRVSRYVGLGAGTPQLTRLSSADWERAKERARKAAHDVAKDLLAIYAARQAAPGYAFSPDTVWQAELEASFPYVETADQLQAIRDVKEDMERETPMDRLICGDVGYGKTEVALRAAFKAVMDGKQVALLVPTTILAQQHFNTFSERLAAYPVKVDLLSRFRSTTQQKKTLHDLKEGKVDIVIGTHRLIQKDVAFKNLGLLIIDEEQRFGVMHKERLKEMRKQVDVLTLTATPIPRTLHMSLIGIRDMSTIDTPPEERLPIVTVVAPYDENLIREAIRREISRGGQVYFVHNRVQSIGYIANRLQKLLPDVSFAIGHGQTKEDELEQVMARFSEGEIDVLISTAIIENGLDIPNVNTIIVDRADQFGLAQLYQLRGRVGRGANRAYAYFLHDRSYQLNATAEQRLKAIFEATELGAGFRIAMKDLEIRGAGNLLGVEQSGNIAAVGFDLYTRLLAQEVEHLKLEGYGENGDGVGGAPEEAGARAVTAGDAREPQPSITLGIDAYLTPEYVPDEAERLALYQRMADLNTPQAVHETAQELTDRFGRPPEEVENLIFVLDVRARAGLAGVESVIAHPREVVVRMREGATFDEGALSSRFGTALRTGAESLRLDRRKLGAQRWRDELRTLLDLLRARQAPAPPLSAKARP